VQPRRSPARRIQKFEEKNYDFRSK
jgi:hypothetical protein